MRLPVHPLEPLLGRVRVDARRAEARVAEHLLHGHQVRTFVEEVRGEGVPERVSAQACAFGDLLQDGVIGRPALIQMTRETYLKQSFIEDRPWFLNAKSAAGGIMMSGGIHDIEMMRMLIGEVESIQALRARQRFTEMEGDDTSAALLRFADGTVGVLVDSFIMKSLETASGREVHTLRIDGDVGSLTTSDGQTIRVFSEREDYLPDGKLLDHRVHVPPQDTFQLQIAHFLDSIRTGTEPITSGRSQRRALEVVLAAYRSMETGQPVRLA
jgi:predicted dehydrogenase